MKAFVVLCGFFLALASAQYDYQPPQREFDAGGGSRTKDDKPTYGPPNHTPGELITQVEVDEEPVAAAPPSAPVPVAREQPAFVSAVRNPAPVSISSQPQITTAPIQAFNDAPSFTRGPAFTQPEAPIRSSSSVGGYQGQGQSFQQEQQQEEGGESYQPKTYRHIYVHSAPDEPTDVQSRVIRVPGGDKHVNVIFVKTPTQSSSHQTEVILPEQDEHKNLVYVLLKKGESTADVKIRRPAAAPQRKPEVYFIRYANQGQQSGGGNGGYQQREEAAVGGGAFRAPNPIRTPEDVPSSGYGAPSRF